MKNTLVKENYSDVKRMAERSKASLVLGVRKHHLTECEIRCLEKAWGEGVWVAPYRKGTRSCFLGALWELGVNQPHDCEKVLVRFKQVAAETKLKRGTVLDSFLKRNGEDASPRLMMGVARELQRLTGMHPYGLKLAQVGMQVNILDLEGKASLSLQTLGIGELVDPRNDFVSPYKKNKFFISVERSPVYIGMSRWTTVKDVEGSECDEN